MSFARFCIQNLYSRPKPLNYQGYTPAHPYTNYASHCRIIVNLFHVCVSCIMEPLQKAGFEGTAMTSGDGNTCWCHPIFALFMGNYPEHILDTGVRMGQCPWCECPKDDLEDGEEEYEYRGLGKILDALSAFDDLDTQIFVHVCSDAGIKPVVLPF